MLVAPIKCRIARPAAAKEAADSASARSGGIITRLRAARRILLGALLCAASQAAAVEFSRTPQFEIAAGPLSIALIEFAQQGRLQFVAPSRALARLRSSELRGAYKPADALEILLRCTGLEGRIEGDVIWLRPQPESSRDDCRIEDGHGAMVASTLSPPGHQLWLGSARQGCEMSRFPRCTMRGSVSDADAPSLAITPNRAFAERGILAAASGLG